MAATNLGKNTCSSDHMHDLMYLDSQATKKLKVEMLRNMIESNFIRVSGFHCDGSLRELKIDIFYIFWVARCHKESKEAPWRALGKTPSLNDQMFYFCLAGTQPLEVQ